MTAKETGKVMEVIRLSYKKSVVLAQEDAQKMLAIWTTMFADTPYEDVAYAVKTYIMTDTSGFPPTIGQLNKIITDAKMSNLPSAEESWQLVRKAISNGIYGSVEEFNALPEICKKIVASPDQLYDWAMLDNKSLGVVRATFIKRYGEVSKDEAFVLSLPTSVKEKRSALAEGQNKVKQLVAKIGGEND